MILDAVLPAKGEYKAFPPSLDQRDAMIDARPTFAVTSPLPQLRCSKVRGRTFAASFRATLLALACAAVGSGEIWADDAFSAEQLRVFEQQVRPVLAEFC